MHLYTAIDLSLHLSLLILLMGLELLLMGQLNHIYDMLANNMKGAPGHIILGASTDGSN